MIIQQMIRDVKEIEESTLWEDTGRQIQNKSKGNQEDTRKTVVFVIGERLSGKSSFIKILKNDFDPDTKPNSLIQYQYSNIGREKKHTVHFYEVGSKQLLPLISSFLAKKDLNLIILICVDLARGRHLVSQTAEIMTTVREIAKNHGKADEETRRNHEDAEFITAMPAKMGIVGCKWDLFEKLDLESKKWISRSLRYLAHTHSASVLTTSNKNTTLGLNLRSAFVQFFFGQPNSASKNAKDHNKPLFIQFGDDKIGDMNLPTSGSMTNIEVLEKQLESAIPHDPRGKVKEQPRNDELVEAGDGKLDEVIRLKRKELFRYGKKENALAKEQANFV